MSITAEGIAVPPNLLCYFYLCTGVPSAPRNLRVENLTKTSVTLSWQAPETDGGGEVSGYFVEKRSNYSTRWVPLNRAPVSLPSYTVRDVTEGDDCEYRVSAVNDAGLGPPSDTTGIVTARDLATKPAPPAALTAQLDASGRVAELRWKKPASDGQSPIVNYVVEMRSNKSPRWKVRHYIVTVFLFLTHIIFSYQPLWWSRQSNRFDVFMSRQ